MKLYIFGVAFATYLVSLNAHRIERMHLPEPEPYSATAFDDVIENYVEQLIDHDDPSIGTWQQRYFVNTHFWNRESPAVFVKLYGEDTPTPGWLRGGSMVHWGAEFGALLFILEHRFFGKSHPFPDTSDEHLTYLTSQQALADVADFISKMTAEYELSPDSKWVMFGGSYAGSLAAWSRLKYPDTIYGAVASSAPLRAEADFWEYDEIVRHSLNTMYPGCGDAITNATKTIQTMLDSNSGMQSLQEKFSFCGGFNPGHPNDRAEFFNGLKAYTVLAVQYNIAPNNIARVCNYMLDESTPQPIDRFSSLRAEQGKDPQGNEQCVPGSFESTVAYEKLSSWNDQATQTGARQWTYMNCNEFGFFRTSPTPVSLFSDTIKLNYYTDECTHVFGSNFNPDQLQAAVARTNENYKGTDIDVSRLIVVQGLLDPWYPLGTLSNPSGNTQQVFIEGAAHCEDVNQPAPSDSQSMTQARDKIEASLKEWLEN